MGKRSKKIMKYSARQGIISKLSPARKLRAVFSYHNMFDEYAVTNPVASRSLIASGDGGGLLFFRNFGWRQPAAAYMLNYWPFEFQKSRGGNAPYGSTRQKERGSTRGHLPCPPSTCLRPR